MTSLTWVRIAGLAALLWGASYFILPVLFVTWILTIGLMGVAHPIVGMAIPLAFAAAVGLPEKPDSVSIPRRERIAAAAICLATATLLLAIFASGGFGTADSCTDCTDSEASKLIWSMAAPFLVLAGLSGIVAITGNVRLARATILFVAIVVGYIVLSVLMLVVYALSFR